MKTHETLSCHAPFSLFCVSFARSRNRDFIFYHLRLFTTFFRAKWCGCYLRWWFLFLFLSSLPETNSQCLLIHFSSFLPARCLTFSKSSLNISLQSFRQLFSLFSMSFFSAFRKKSFEFPFWLHLNAFSVSLLLGTRWARVSHRICTRNARTVL